MAELKPCPFCGSDEKSALKVRDNDFDYFFVSCYRCHTKGPLEEIREKAIEAWNKRS